MIKYFHFYCGIKQSFSELSSGITTARGCGVGGDLVQYLQVELKLKKGKVEVSAGGTQTKKFKKESEGGQDFLPFSCTFAICIIRSNIFRVLPTCSGKILSVSRDLVLMTHRR